MNRLGIMKRSLLCLWMISLVIVCVFLQPHVVCAQNNRTQDKRTQDKRTQDKRPRGKVLIVRGLFTVFSLGLDSLGEKLRDEGLDVQVVPAFRASAVANEIRQEVLKDPKQGPVVIIGHSRGGDIAPVEARKFGQSDLPVDLIVIVDTVRNAVIPSNVKRCVNLYTTNALGIYSGERVTAQSKETKLLNLHVKDLQGRGSAAFINHFNIDSSDAIHQRIIQEVLQACPAHAEPEVASRPPTPEATRISKRPTYHPLILGQ